MKEDTNKNQHDNGSENNGVEREDDTIAQELSALSPEVKREIQEIRSMGMFMSGTMAPPSHKLFDKFEPEHITQFLNIGRQDDENRYDLEKRRLRFSTIVIFVISIIFVFLVIFLAQDNKDLLADIIKIGIGVISGSGFGFGFKTYLDRK